MHSVTHMSRLGCHHRPITEPGRVSGKYGQLVDQVPLDAALAALATTQHAVFELDQLRDAGLTAGAVYRRAATGRLHRIHRRVYSLVPARLLSREGHWMAAVLACGPGAVLSHRSAAALLKLRGTYRARIDITVPARSSRTHAGIEVHRSTTLVPTDTTRVNNIPCITVARTQLDVAEVLNRRGVERVFDQAEILEVFDLRKLEDQLARNPKRRGAQIVRAVLAEHYIGSTATWSKLEEEFLAALRAAGMPQSQVNEWIVLPDGGPAIRADFVWRARRARIETDGYRTHRTRQAFERDRGSDQRLLAAGRRSMRATRRQLERELDQVVAATVALLRL